MRLLVYDADMAASKFKKGNTVATKARGVPKPASGQRTAAATVAMKRDIDLFLDTVCVDRVPKGDKFIEVRQSLYERAVATTVKALDSRDELGNVNGVALKAAQTVIGYRLGLPRQTVEVRGKATINLFAKLDAIKAAALAKTISED